MKGFKSKKGISLIVLVITIIVMIILAAAIILSLNNSGIIDKANKAKKDSDTANLKEYVNVLEAEWELMSEAERAGKTSTQYVNEKLYDKYPDAALGADGEVYTGLTANAREAIVKGIMIGDVVTGYSLDDDDDKVKYTTSGNENTQPNRVEDTPTKQIDIARIEYTTWKYIGIGKNGEILIAPDMVDSVTDSQKIKLSGKGGYSNGPDELNNMCKAMYSTSKGTARSMNIDDINRILDYTGNKGGYYDTNDDLVTTKTPMKISEIEKKLGTKLGGRVTPDGRDIGEYDFDDYRISSSSADILKSVSDSLKTKLKSFVFSNCSYWLASTSCYSTCNFMYVEFCVRYVNSSDIYRDRVCDSYDGHIDCETYCSVRPVVVLNSNIQLTKVSNGNWSI